MAQRTKCRRSSAWTRCSPLGERLPAVGWLGAALILGATLLLKAGAALRLRLGRTGTVAPPGR
jgi:hypothetical protein